MVNTRLVKLFFSHVYLKMFLIQNHAPEQQLQLLDATKTPINFNINRKGYTTTTTTTTTTITTTTTTTTNNKFYLFLYFVGAYIKVG